MLDFKKLFVFPDGAIYDRANKCFLDVFKCKRGKNMCIQGNYGPMLVHRLVANKYCGGRHKGGRQDLTVDHIDTNKMNNQAENLQWMSGDDNLLYWRKYQRYMFD